MASRRVTAVLSLALITSVACGGPTVEWTEAQRSAIRDSVSVALADFARHASEAHWDSLGALYSESPAFRFFESGVLQYQSAAEVRRALTELPEGMHIETEYERLAIEPLAPGIAVVTALFRSKFTSESGPEIGFGGAVTLVWSHEPQGWRILSGHSSAPVPRGP